MGANEKEQLMAGTIHIGSTTTKYRSGKWTNVHIPNIHLSKMSYYYLNIYSYKVSKYLFGIRTSMDGG